MRKKTTAGYYINNSELLEELALYKEAGKMSEKLGGMILQIAKNFSNKGNFAGYTWKEDMVNEAVLSCVRYLGNFDPNKSNNPFAYITTICKNTFINFIKKQNKHSDLKDILYQNREIFVHHGDQGEVQKAIDYTILK